MELGRGLVWLGWILPLLVGCGGMADAVTEGKGDRAADGSLAEAGTGLDASDELGSLGTLACPTEGLPSAGEPTSDTYLTNGSFENGMDGWTAESGAEIDTQYAHGGQKSLRLRVSASSVGVYPNGTVNSVTLKGLKPKTVYRISFWYRFDNCVRGALALDWGTLTVPLEGSQCDWKQGDYEIYVQEDPTNKILMIKTGHSVPYPQCVGTSGDAAMCEAFQDNFVWVDDFKVEERE